MYEVIKLLACVVSSSRAGVVRGDIHVLVQYHPPRRPPPVKMRAAADYCSDWLVSVLISLLLDVRCDSHLPTIVDTMYHLFKGLHTYLTRKDEYSVVIIGLDNVRLRSLAALHPRPSLAIDLHSIGGEHD
jgi:hypothetical protein